MWVLIWRFANVVLSAVGLGLLLEDIWHRRRLHLRARFYWEAVALLLFATGWGNIDAAVNPPANWNPARTAVGTVALVYFLISIQRVRVFNRREEAADGYGGPVPDRRDGGSSS